MRLLRNYLLKEFFTPLIFALFILTFVMLLGNLIKIADLVINKGVDIASVTKLFLFMVPSLLTYTLPIATLVAVLLALGRLSSDNEIIAIRASGIGIFQMVLPILVLGILLSMLLVIFNDRVIPYAHFATRKTLIEVGIKNPTAALEPGVFINSFDKYILFIYAIEDNKMTNVRIYEPQGENKPTRIIIAKKGEFIPDPTQPNVIKLKLVEGTADEPDPNNPSNFFKLNFKNYFMTLNLSQMRDKNSIEKKPKDMTIKELKNEADRLKEQGITPTPLLNEITRKISLAFSSFVFILIGLPLAIITKRREKSINFGIAFVIVIIYYLLLLGSEALSTQGIFDPQLTLWLPDIVLGGIGLLLTYRLCAS
jgi:lipopolysaccharide export system permease protein